MKYSFEVIYEIDCTVGEAVVAYLDAEHYMFLHQSHLPRWEALSLDGLKVKSLMTWQKGPVKIGNSCINEYVPPARFLNYDLKPFPIWVPSIHHIIKTYTDLRYYPTEDGQRTVSHLLIKLDLPWFLWPFRHLLQKQLTRLKIEKDQEDVDMIARHQAVFGRGNLADYFRKEVFLLHKEVFVEHFAHESQPKAASSQSLQ